MKVTATTRSSLDSTTVRNRLAETVAQSVTDGLARGLQDERAFERTSGRADDPDARRAALARVLRRHFGTPL